MSETKVPTIPALSGITDAKLRTILAAIKETIEVREALRGDELDSFVKVRDLTEAGIANFRKRRSGTSLVNPLGPLTDYDIPPALKNFEVTGGYTQMFLEWDYLGPLNYTSFSHVEIWRSATDALGTATQIGETTAAVYSDACGSSKAFYYWGRAVSKAGVVGPFNAVRGTYGETAVDVEYLLGVLTGSITESQLYADLGARIDLIDAPETNLNSVNARVKALRDETEGSVAQVNARVDVLTAYDETLLTAINQIIVVDQGQAAEIYLEQTARIAADSAQAAQIESLTALVGQNAANITNEQTARATADTALTNSLNTQISRIDANTATITSNYQTLAGVDSALTSAVNQLSSTVGGNTATIQTQATSINGLSAQYSVKLDNNGMVSGFGLASVPSEAGGSTSAFGIRADRFWIAAPGATQTSTPAKANIPFIVSSGAEDIEGVTVPAGVWMNTAFIANATITNAKIGIAAIDDAKIASLSAAKVTFGTMLGDRIGVNTLNADRLMVNTLAARLALIEDAYIGTANIKQAAIKDAHIDTLNANKINAGTIAAGRIAAGSITTDKLSVNSLSAITATIGVLRTINPGQGWLEIRDNVIKVYDASGVVRVQLGNLAL